MAIELKVKKKVNFDGVVGDDLIYLISPKDEAPQGYPLPLHRTYDVFIENLSTKEFAISKRRHTYQNGNEVYKDTGVVIKTAERKKIDQKEVLEEYKDKREE